MRREGKFRLGVALVLLMWTLLAGGIAHAETEDVDPLEMSFGETSLSITHGFSKRVQLVFRPASIEAGIDCGMPEMCGIDPCTCGSSDQWGRCSCNGLATVYPEITAVSSDDGVVQAQSRNDGVLIVKGLEKGTAEILVTARLLHYQDVEGIIQVEIIPVHPVVYAVGILLVGCALVMLFRLVQRNKRSAWCLAVDGDSDQHHELSRD